MSEIANTYLTQQVECSEPAQLTELLYRRAVNDLHSAVELWPELHSSPKAIHQIVHAQSIIKELYGTLNFAEGGSLAFELGRVYEFIQYTLTETVSNRAPELPAEYHSALRMLEEIGDSWSQMLRNEKLANHEGAAKERVA